MNNFFEYPKGTVHSCKVNWIALLIKIKNLPKIILVHFIERSINWFLIQKGMIGRMNYLVKMVDVNNKIYYVTPGDHQDPKCLGAREKAEKFTMKKAAVDVIVKMKRIQDMRNYVYHIEQVE